MMKYLAAISIICAIIVIALTSLTGNYIAGVWAFNSICWAGVALVKELE